MLSNTKVKVNGVEYNLDEGEIFLIHKETGVKMKLFPCEASWAVEKQEFDRLVGEKNE